MPEGSDDRGRITRGDRDRIMDVTESEGSGECTASGHSPYSSEGSGLRVALETVAWAFSGGALVFMAAFFDSAPMLARSALATFGVVYLLAAMITSGVAP